MSLPHQIDCPVTASGKIPAWLTRRAVLSDEYRQLKDLLKQSGLHSVCESAFCPNIYECFSQRHVTFMILGNICTRNCRFCGVTQGKPEPPEDDEPWRIARAVAALNLAYTVITSVTRDDLPDGGASHFRAVTRAIKNSSVAKVELLLPDFQGKEESLHLVFDSEPDVIGHNLETVPSLYPRVRPGASYEISLNVIRKIKKAGFLTKSSLMLGLGETQEEVSFVLKDLSRAGCDFLVLGQYLRPHPRAVPVKEYLPPEVFQQYWKLAVEMGFKKVF
ncbi:MAG TPA: lipoyl synthase, partial [bacterium]|nr:lipoyl synthase [bacterium]